MNSGPYPIATEVPRTASRRRDLPVMRVEREWTREKRALALLSCNSRRCGYTDASRVASVECVTVNPKEGGCVLYAGVVFSP